MVPSEHFGQAHLVSFMNLGHPMEQSWGIPMGKILKKYGQTKYINGVVYGNIIWKRDEQGNISSVH